ncbi:L-glutamate gamma-semialdehyde dehydrogenase [Nitrososphaera sp.]|uniref:L-glutamate gamma-semialdehyde dehydrogenase n=1 Tax=Nitrososphaera sp. TaxID=1971748 RepID=UPI00317EA334
MFENEHTLRHFMTEKAEGQFHDRYEKALEQVRPEFGRKYPMIINGKEVRTAQTFSHSSPIDTRIVLGHFPAGTARHARLAVASAKKAFEEWGRTDWRERVRIFRAAADLMSRKKFELAAWVSYENGKNRFEAIGDVDEAIDFVRYYAEEMERNNGFETPMKSAQPNERSKSVMKPYGVWGVIAPFNFPAAILTGMTTGALITGNTVVLKPSSDAPIVAFKIAEIFFQAGVPAGALNVVYGSGSKVGGELVASKDVSGIVFTGSREVGYSMSRQFGRESPRPLIAELGGKNPAIVTETADLNKAVEGVMKAAFGYSGQKCSACSRVFVHKKVRDEFLRKLVDKTKSLPVGNPLDPNTFMGPLVNEDAYKKFQQYARLADRDGKVLAGGYVRREGELKHGYYVEPTIVAGLPKNHRLFREELFVPILCVADYDKFDDAIKMANDADYGLTAGIFSGDSGEVKKFLDHIEAGVVYVNRQASATTGAMVGCQPFGGWKDSGTTGKNTGGPHYLTQFLREQSQTIVE